MIIIYVIALLIVVVIGSGWNYFLNPPPPIEPKQKKQRCLFEGEDLFNNKVYDKKGNLITNQPYDLTCDRCSDYLYRESTEKCVGYTSDDGVCIPKLEIAKPCPSEFFLE